MLTQPTDCVIIRIDQLDMELSKSEELIELTESEL